MATTEATRMKKDVVRVSFVLVDASETLYQIVSAVKAIV